VVTRGAVLSDAAWARIEPLLPPVNKAMGRPFRPPGPVVENMMYRADGGAVARFASRFRGWTDRVSPVPGVVERATARSTGCWPSCSLMLTRPGSWSGRCRGLHDCPCSARDVCCEALSAAVVATGALPVDKKRRCGGRNRRSRHRPVPWWLSTTAHALVDGKGRLRTLIVRPGHVGDSPVLPLLLGELRVARRGRAGHAPAGAARGQGLWLGAARCSKRSSSSIVLPGNATGRVLRPSYWEGTTRDGGTRGVSVPRLRRRSGVPDVLRRGTIDAASIRIWLRDPPQTHARDTA